MRQIVLQRDRSGIRGPGLPFPALRYFSWTGERYRSMWDRLGNRTSRRRACSAVYGFMLDLPVCEPS